MELLVLDHHPDTGLCRFDDVLAGRRELVGARSLDVPSGAHLPDDLDAVAGLVVMGGPQSVMVDHPWLAGELDLLRRAVDAEVPVFAVCLGAQLLAHARGGTVATRSVPEIGFVPLHHLDAAGGDELAAGWPDGAATFVWHGDEVTSLPPGATPLLTGPEGTAAWRLGSAFATQAHPEVDAAQIARWVEHDELRAQFASSDVDPAVLLAAAARYDRFTVATGAALFGRFVDGPVRRRVTGSTR